MSCPAMLPMACMHACMQPLWARLRIFTVLLGCLGEEL
jgi:hypothetical protein